MIGLDGNKNFKNIARYTALSLFIFTLFISNSAVAQYTSPGYQSNEVFFGTGGEVESTSPNFRAQSSVGGLGVGSASSTNFQANSGFLTPGDPFLEVVVNSSTVNLGDLDASSAKTATTTFSVRAYTDSGYTVFTVGGPLTNADSDTITSMGSQASSTAGTEQFGINLKANTSPATFGAEPSPQPDSSFASGQAASGYNTANQFKFVSGDTIAQTGTNGWGATIFTISYIANINPITEAGNYSMTQDLIAVATY